MDYEKIGEKIRKNRILRNKSQEKFAEEVDISPSYLGQIERGQRKASLKTLEKISKKLEIPVGNLISDMSIDEELNRVWELEMKRLKPEDKEKVAVFMKSFFKLINQISKTNDIE